MPFACLVFGVLFQTINVETTLSMINVALAFLWYVRNRLAANHPSSVSVYWRRKWRLERFCWAFHATMWTTIERRVSPVRHRPKNQQPTPAHLPMSPPSRRQRRLSVPQSRKLTHVVRVCYIWTNWLFRVVHRNRPPYRLLMLETNWMKHHFVMRMTIINA